MDTSLWFQVNYGCSQSSVVTCFEKCEPQFPVHGAWLGHETRDFNMVD